MKGLKITLLMMMTVVCSHAFAQDTLKVVQFSGKITDKSGAELLYTNVAVKGTSRGTVSDIDGFFSLPVRESETVLFSRIGYEFLEYKILCL